LLLLYIPNLVGQHDVVGKLNQARIFEAFDFERAKVRQVNENTQAW